MAERSRRIRITLAYDGTDFHGWQFQPGLETIQGILEKLISDLEGTHVAVAGSGRTDAGVHALAQVAAFTIENPLPVDNLRRAVNRLLPPTIRITDCRETHTDFHPRFDAIAKTYQYKLFRAETCSPFDWHYLHHHPWPVNEDWMIEGAKVFEGSHDFTAFSAKDDRRADRSKVRTIYSSDLVRTGDYLIYTVRGRGFLKYMVRNLVGTLIEMGRGNLPHNKIPYKSGATVPAKGLTMVSVEYPESAAADTLHATLNP
jgi:tRNA pseudouridine38-40 synthase